MSNIPLNIPQLGNRFVDDRQRVAGDSYNWSWNRPLTQVQKLVIHHTVTKPKASWQEEVDEVASIHLNTKKWGGVGYHFLITSQGIVAYVGDIGTARANVKNHNEKVIGICMVGDFTKHLPTDIQINSTHDLCDFFLNNYPNLNNVTDWDDVIGHKDAVAVFGNTTATQCPASSWPNDMKDRIRHNIVYSPQPTPSPPAPQLTPEPTPEPTPIPTPQPIPPPNSNASIKLKAVIALANSRWTWIGTKGWKNRLAELRQILS